MLQIHQASATRDSDDQLLKASAAAAAAYSQSLVNDLKALQQNVGDRLSNHQNHVMKELEQHYQKRIDSIQKQMQRLYVMEENLIQSSLELHSKLHQVNQQQVLQLKRRLQTTYEKEQNRRQLLLQQQEKISNWTNQMSSTNPPENLENAVQLQDLGHLIDGDGIADQMKNKAQKWIMSQVDIYTRQTHANVSERATTKHAQAVQQVNRTMSLLATKRQAINQQRVERYLARQKHICVNPLQGAHLIQQALGQHVSHDGTGRPDILQRQEQGKPSVVVHEWTSPTYVPPPNPQTDLLGNAWWRRYIPQDVERILPEGWENLDVSVPSFVYHVLGLRGAKTLPPEAIMDPNTYPGACWPMKMMTASGEDDDNQQHNSAAAGYVTLRFPRPVLIHAITYDHAPRVLMEKLQALELGTAPKRMRLVGFPPCSNDDEGNTGIDCVGLGFNSKEGQELLVFEYNALEGKSKQTFDIIGDDGDKKTEMNEAVGEDPFGSKDDEEEGGGGGASCSAVKPSCGANPPEPQKDIPMAAIRLEVLENYGNGDFTCLYRLRVHGEELIEE